MCLSTVTSSALVCFIKATNAIIRVSFCELVFVCSFIFCSCFAKGSTFGFLGLFGLLGLLGLLGLCGLAFRGIESVGPSNDEAALGFCCLGKARPSGVGLEGLNNDELRGDL